MPRREGEGFARELRGVLPSATQFAFGSLWSAFLVFSARSGVFVASWPFLLILAGLFIGNEVFRAYHSRFIFTSVLLFFALLSYAIFMVPVFTEDCRHAHLRGQRHCSDGGILSVHAIAELGERRASG